jgi:hypothetical protein
MQDVEKLARAFMRRGIPKHGALSLAGYVLHGWSPGGFLQAVLENDLVVAAHHADATNRNHLYDYAAVLQNDVPHNCWGSRSAVIKWLDKGGLEGRG